MEQKIKIDLGKINFNKVVEAIDKLKWEGKGRKEIYSFLENGEYKESEREYIDVFGEVDSKITIFLNELYKKYNYYINKDNFKEFLREIEEFSKNYKYIIIDKRKTKEELLKEQEELKRLEKEREEQKKKEEEELHKKGLLTKEEKISLGIKEIARRIREKLKKEFKDCVFSVTFKRFAGGSELEVSLMKASFKVIKDIKEIKEEDLVKYGITREKQERIQKEKYNQLNHYSFKNNYSDGYNNGVFLTRKAWEVLKRVCEIVNYYNYDDSDPMTDYFDVNFYFRLSIGKWDKPFIYEPKKESKTKIKKEDISIKKNEEKQGIEIYFKEKPSSDVLDKLKSNGFRWSRYNKCWYKKYYDGVEQEIKNLLKV